MAAGRSWRVSMGERISYGGFLSWRAMACVTVKEAVGAQRPMMVSYCLETVTNGWDGPRVPARIVQP
jgi:hypothetical protein